jgi:hypothetical protein
MHHLSARTSITIVYVCGADVDDVFLSQGSQVARLKLSTREKAAGISYHVHQK